MSHVTHIKVCKTPITICTRLKNLTASLWSSYHKEVWRVCRTLETLLGLIAKTTPMSPKDGGRRLCWKPDVVVLRQFRDNLDLKTGRSGDTADEKKELPCPKGRCAPHPPPAHLREPRLPTMSSLGSGLCNERLRMKSAKLIKCFTTKMTDCQTESIS